MYVCSREDVVDFCNMLMTLVACSEVYLNILFIVSFVEVHMLILDVCVSQHDTIEFFFYLIVTTMDLVL